jgi:hypothetical protein
MKRLICTVACATACLLMSAASASAANDLTLLLDTAAGDGSTIAQMDTTGVTWELRDPTVPAAEVLSGDFPGDVPCPEQMDGGSGGGFLGGRLGRPFESGTLYLSGTYQWGTLGVRTLCGWAYEPKTNMLDTTPPVVIARTRKVVTVRWHIGKLLAFKGPKAVKAGKPVTYKLAWVDEVDWADEVTVHAIRGKRCPAHASQAGKVLHEEGTSYGKRQAKIKLKRGVRTLCVYITGGQDHHTYSKLSKRVTVR